MHLTVKGILYISGLAPLLVITSIKMGSLDKEQEKAFPQLMKVALRNTGNALLLQYGDSTSLVLPIVESSKNHFSLSFEKDLNISPDSLVKHIQKNFTALGVPEEYIVEVEDCASQQIAYSYFISPRQEKNMVPCLGRKLPVSCYTIKVAFDNPSLSEMGPGQPYWFALGVLGILGLMLLYKTYSKQDTDIQDTWSFVALGDYRFYNDQNKLVKGDLTIPLTSKESELLKIFSNNRNQIVKRDFLLKEVWEDKGVFVGRSLDTFVSKLRKKFKGDSQINLKNVHGVGYRLEINQKKRP